MLNNTNSIDFKAYRRKTLHKLYSAIIAVLILEISFFILNLNKPFTDYENYSIVGRHILNGINPYTTDIREINYPPGQFFLYALIILIFGDTYKIFKIVVFMVYLLDCVLFYFIMRLLAKTFFYSKHAQTFLNKNLRLIKKGIKNEIPLIFTVKENFVSEQEHIQFRIKKISLTGFLIYLSFPPNWMRSTAGLNDVFPIFFTLLFLLFFIKKRIIPAGISFGLALIIKFTTLFIIPVLFLYFFIRRDWKALVRFFLPMFIVIIGIFLPFLIDDYYATLSGIGTLFNRPTEIANHFRLFPQYHYFYENTISLGPFNLSIWFFIEVAIYLTVLLLIYRILAVQSYDFLFISIVLVYFMLPIATHSFGIRYYMWAAPFFCAYVVSKNEFSLLIPFAFFPVFTIFYYSLENYVIALIIGVPLNLYLFGKIISIAFKMRELVN